MSDTSPGEHPPSRFERSPDDDPRTRTDQALAFEAGSDTWRPPAWFGRVAVTLFETNDVVNIGGVSRAMANTGFERLRLIDPVPFDRWDVIGIAHYTEHIVDRAVQYTSLRDAVADAQLVVAFSGKHHRAQRNALPMHAALARVQAAAEAGQTVALLFGREDTGLPVEALDLCHTVVTIPTNPAHPSLNLAQAALLVLYALFQRSGGEQQPLRPPQKTAPPATAEMLEDFFADLERALRSIAFLDHRSPAGTMRSLRMLFYRASLDAREVGLLRSISIEIRRYLHRHGLLPEVGPIGAERSQVDPSESAN